MEFTIKFFERFNPLFFKWDDKFNKLAIYNSEVSRGIIHTEEFKAKMAVLQEEYNQRIKKYCV